MSDRMHRIPFLRLVTPVGFLKAAATIASVYMLLHVSGFREETGFLSGTTAPGTWRMAMGFFYVCAYFGFVLAVPVLLLGSGIFALLLRRGRKS